MRVEERPVRACASLGATWTCVGSLVVAVELNGALGGRTAFAEAFGAGGALRQWIVLLLVVGAGAGWAMLSAKLRTDAPSVQGFRRLQYTAMPVALVFLLVHASLTWGTAALGSDPGTVYEGLRRSLPNYPMIAVYVVGLAALGLATEQGLLVWAASRVTRPATMRWLRFFAAAFPVVAFVVAVNGLGQFVAGRGLLWRPEPAEPEAIVAPEAPEPERREPESPVGMPEGDPEP